MLVKNPIHPKKDISYFIKKVQICYQNQLQLFIQEMWHPYQYAQGKLKLVKDLKTGQANLRVSLIDQQEISDIGRIFEERKGYYKIDNHSMTAPQAVEQQFQEEGTGHLSYKQKVQLYRRRLQSEKLENKYNNLFKKTQKRRFQMRNPILFKLLQNFQESHKHQDNLKVVDDLKQSEKNLEMIKINTNRRAKFDNSHVQNAEVQRPRFLSLENGLPEKQRMSFPKWKDYAERKFTKNDKTNEQINIMRLQSELNQRMGVFPIKSQKHSQSAINHAQSFHRQLSSPQHHIKPYPSARTALHHENSMVKAQTRIDGQQQHDVFNHTPCEKCKQNEKQDDNKIIQQSFLNRGIKSKSAYVTKRVNRNKNIENVSNVAIKTFSKSQICSKDVIQTMNGFYNSKNRKKTDYKKMVLFLKQDRPLTSEIRRKNYKMIGQTQLKQVKQYRNCSQKERINIREENYNFYLHLLKKMQAHGVQQLPLSGKLIERIRTIFQSNYQLNNQHFQLIAEPSLYEERDPMSEILLKEVQSYIKKYKK